MKRFVPLILFLVASSACQEPEKKETAPRLPNIVLIMADDLGYGDLGAYRQAKIETPHIDALARGGMRFTQFYSGAPVCAPARSVLMTGLHAGHTPIRGNDEWRERGEVWDYAQAVEDPNLEGQRPLPAATMTVGSLLQQQGYVTGIVGKWGLGAPLTEGIPTQKGFDYFFGYNCQRQAHTYFPKHLWENEQKVWLDNELVVPGTKLPEGADPLDTASYADFWLNDFAGARLHQAALHFIDENQDQPFFLYVASPIPHVPLQAPKRWVDHYVKKFGDEDPYLGEKGYFPNRYPRATYAAMVSYLDEQVGELVEKLKSLGLYENTLILFTSDNGPTFNGGTDSPYFDSGGPFKCEQGWGKGFVHEGGIRVPMIAHWPGKIMAGTETDHQGIFYDILPTLAEVSQAPVPEKTDGISLLPVLLREDVKPRHEFLYWEFPAYGGQQAVRMGNWKGIRRNMISDGNLKIELYDLKNDPLESTDVAGDHPEVVRRIDSIMRVEHQTPEIDRFKMAVLDE